MFKHLPNDKTVVTEFKVVLADIAIRQQMFSESMAAKITGPVNFRSGDMYLDSTRPEFDLGLVEQVLIVHGYYPFKVEITQGTSVLVLPSTGLVLMYSRLDRVKILLDQSAQRLRYVVA